MTLIARTFGILFFILANVVVADETRGTAAEAQAMVARAVAAYDDRGKAAFAAMNPPSTEFRDRDLYVFVIGPDNRTVVNGLDASRVGRNLAETVDSAGKAFGQEMIDRANDTGVWVDYAWRDPLTGKDVQKSSWVVRRHGYIFGSGIYKP